MPERPVWRNAHNANDWVRNWPRWLVRPCVLCLIPVAVLALPVIIVVEHRREIAFEVAELWAAAVGRWEDHRKFRREAPDA